MEPITIGIALAAAGAFAYSKYGKSKAASATAAKAKKSVQSRVRDAIETGDPDRLDALAKELLAEEQDEAATSVSALAAQWRKDAAFQAEAIAAMKAAGVPVVPGGKDPTKLEPVSPPAAKPVESQDESETVRTLAAKVLANLEGSPTGKEDKRLMAAFQDAANKARWVPALKVDGLYGEGSRQALRYYLGGRDVPLPRYGSSKGQAYKPASSSEGGRVDDRYLQGQAVVGTVTGKNKKNYPAATRATVAKFQAMMGVSPADGLYGKQTIAALKSVGISNPPPAIY